MWEYGLNKRTNPPYWHDSGLYVGSEPNAAAVCSACARLYCARFQHKTDLRERASQETTCWNAVQPSCGLPAGARASLRQRSKEAVADSLLITPFTGPNRINRSFAKPHIVSAYSHRTPIQCVLQKPYPDEACQCFPII